MPLLIIRDHEIRELLPMKACIGIMDQAMRALSAGTVDVPERIIAPLADGRSYFILMPGLMPLSEGDGHPGPYGAKLVGLHPDNPAGGRPAVQGFVSLFDGRTGEPVALLGGASITAIRTAAASALATRELARPDARSHGIFGAGVLAATHLEAIACVRDIEQVVLWARDPAKARQFAERYRDPDGPEIRVTTDQATAAACDVVSLVTNSPTPVLRGDWLREGAHLNLVGAHEPEHREADSEAVAKSRIYVDSRSAALAEAGDLLIPMQEGRIGPDAIVGEIGELLLERVPGRRDDRQVTLYKSLGTFAQDLFAAVSVYDQARARGLGAEIEF
ncbi:MAG: ornithine cyclodeaminase family protein [Gammaproteobacteria bacterium]|nr:ornithine cyclodeaminase family protein [Gammaproteobacteria bacterium]